MTVKNKINFGLWGMAGLLIAGAAQAAPVCNSVSECGHLITAAKQRVQELRPGAQLGPIVRTFFGSVARMNQYEAQKYCESKGKRLPTVKELALGMNPKGVHNVPVQGVRLQKIYKQDLSVDFYYDDTTYVMPEGDARDFDDYNHAFLSSSIHPDGSNYAYNISGMDGRISYYERDGFQLGAVRCIGR